jgi:hypothetical protein
MIGPDERRELKELLASCYCPKQVKNPEGQTREGYFNIKKLYGHPDKLRRLVEIISPHIRGDILCAPDHGSTPLVAALAFQLRRIRCVSGSNDDHGCWRAGSAGRPALSSWRKLCRARS